MNVNANIYAKCMWIVRQGAMRMAIKRPGSVMRSVKNTESIMTESDMLVPYLYLLILVQKFYFLGVNSIISELAQSLIVISKQYLNITIHSPQIIAYLFFGPETKITQKISDLIVFDFRVPIVDDRFIHFGNMHKGPVRIFDNILMAQMKITAEPNVWCVTHSSPPSYASLQALQ
jgi:hypothetical protein